MSLSSLILLYYSKKIWNKKIKIITPPNLHHSKEMAQIVGKKKLGKIQKIHLERSLLPEKIIDENGKQITRPKKYG